MGLGKKWSCSVQAARTHRSEGVILAFDRNGYWIEGGSIVEYLRNTTPGPDAASKLQFIEDKRIHWAQGGERRGNWRKSGLHSLTGVSSYLNLAVGQLFRDISNRSL